MLTEKEKHDLALTIAGEIHPRLSPYGTRENRAEIANILATIENRFRINKPGAFGKTDQQSKEIYRSRSDVVRQPQQYSTWNDEVGRSRARANYSLFSYEIERAISDFYRGNLKASSPFATHYWAPSGMLRESGKSKPSWAAAIEHQIKVGPHVFGTARGLLDDAMIAAIENEGGAVPTKRGYAASDRLRDAVQPSFGPLAGDMTTLQEAPASDRRMDERHERGEGDKIASDTRDNSERGAPGAGERDPIADIIERSENGQATDKPGLGLDPTIHRLLSGNLSALDPENGPFSPNLLRMLMGGKVPRVKGAIRLHDIARPPANRVGR